MKTVLIITAVTLGLALATGANAAKMGGVCQKGTKLQAKSPGPNSNWTAATPCCDGGAGTGGLTIQCSAKVTPAVPGSR